MGLVGEAGIVVLGAGVAGLAAARFLLERGERVLLVAEALGEASRVPVALVNPLRGRRFTLAAEGERALEAALSFYGRFAELHMGVFRPVPEGERAKVAGRLGGLRHRWEGKGVLLEDAFWLEPRLLLERLAEGLPLLRARVAAWEPPYLVLEGGKRVRGEVLVYAGGGRGAHLLGLEGRHIPGLVLTLLDYFPRAISYRVYLAGSALGGSYLPHRSDPEAPPPTEGEVEWLLKGVEDLLGYRPLVASAWRGVRFRLSTPSWLAPRRGPQRGHEQAALVDGATFACGYLGALPGGQDLPYLFPVDGGFALTGFGSTGFLYAPWLGERLLEALGW
ncbi:FAD-dependent oxidoreductase [Thermus tengchongensis]|uniref:FAD-dependent oxidoreductase n=1 Tax=Thermus tengchongensis TaxID=1214928 RepID=UPI000570FDD1|nr:FAD-dependent oxidoreductase [Thermus tengchongensis]